MYSPLVVIGWSCRILHFPVYQFSVCQWTMENSWSYIKEAFLVNRHSFLNERYLSASLYRPTRRADASERRLYTIFIIPSKLTIPSKLNNHQIGWEGGRNDESFEDGDFLVKDDDDEESAWSLILHFHWPQGYSTLLANFPFVNEQWRTRDHI